MRLSCDPNEILWYAMSSPFRREMKAKALLDAHVSGSAFIPCIIQKKAVTAD